ncbi:MAG: glycoside hydrolase family 38 C-terminal domain-containing protein [Phycisphaerae bacterium]
MFKTPALTRGRVQKFLEKVVRPAVYGPTAALEIEMYQCPDPIPYEQAVRQKFRPATVGVRIGPKWSTAWFHLQGKIPAEMAGQKVVLRFRSETEALVYRNGVPDQGMEKNHDDYGLAHPAKGGEAVDLFLECGVNTFFGAGGGSREDSRVPINSLDQPGAEGLFGHLHRCDIAVLYPEVRALAWDLEFLHNLEGKLPEKSPRKRQILWALNDALNALDADDIPGTAAAARAILEPVIQTPAGGSAAACYGVGHAHIDTAWLWPLRETVRKCARTFSTQCQLMDEYPDYVFQASQAQLYAFTKQNYPGLFEKIKERVKRGQWEPGGAMWVEADCNIPGGESLVRQILHGTNFWKREFGISQSYLWLPDVFGYSAALPQILKQAGVDYFVTQKISWNQINKFPHHSFYWEGIDGTKVLSHFLPADTYNASNLPEELIHGQENNLDADRANLYLTAYGFGDGGGGPTREHIERIHRAADCDGLPKARCARVDTFLKDLAAQSKDLQTWVGELYLELHRGTYTTQAQNKRANRQSEFLLHDAEFLAATRPEAGGGGAKNYPAAVLDQAWKTVLLNQFHDIIPGSSITWVYEDSQDQYRQVRQEVGKVIADATAGWAGAINTSGMRRPVVVFNTLSWDDSELVVLPEGAVPAGAVGGAGGSLRDGTGRVVSPLQKIELANGGGAGWLARALDVPPLGYAAFELSDQAAPLAPAEVVVGSVAATGGGGTGGVLENRLLRVELEGAGRITRLYDKLARREIVDAGQPANQWVLYEDKSNNWPAWDIDLHYLEKPRPIDTPAELKLVEAGPLRAVIEVKRALGQASQMVQRIQLAAESLRVDFVTHVEWQEADTLLRVLHPVNVLAPRATFEIQFGHAERPTHFNTSWDWARFEVCAQKWADLSEPGYGVALLNTGKYGHSCHGHVLGLSLLRAPDEPDPKADRGPQDFTYALLPHAGDFRVATQARAGVIQQAYRLNAPLLAVATTSHAGTLGLRGSVCSCDQPNVIIETIKQAEEGDALIVRLYEAYGQRGPARLTVHVPFKKATAVDLLERPTDLYTVRATGMTIDLELTPFAIRTIKLER